LQGAGRRVHGAGFDVQGSGFRVQGSGFRVQGSGCRVQGAGCRVQGSGFRVQGSRCRVHAEPRTVPLRLLLLFRATHLRAHCRVRHIRQSRPVSGLDFQAKQLPTPSLFPFQSTAGGVGGLPSKINETAGKVVDADPHLPSFRME